MGWGGGGGRVRWGRVGGGGEDAGREGGGGGVYWGCARLDDRMEAKIKSPPNPKGLQQNPTKSLDQKFTSQKIPCRIPEP